MAFSDISAALSTRAEDICRELFPQGKKVGKEWHVGDITGAPGESLKFALVGPHAGKGKDYATGWQGDLLDAVRDQKGISPAEAADWARHFLGLPAFKPNGNHIMAFDPLKFGFKRKDETEYRYGVAAWCYRNAQGEPEGWVVRFQRPDGSKDTLPLCLVDGKPRWKSWTESGTLRPLYNLHLLARRPDAPVLIVEGEKTAEAASKLFPSHVCITWRGGAQNVSKADWTPIIEAANPSDESGAEPRDVVLWPDADKAGREAMAYIKARIPSTRLVRTTDLPDGWDLADPVPEGVSVTGLFDAASAIAAAPSSSCPAHASLIYESWRQCWWTLNTRQHYITINETTARRILREAGFTHWSGGELSPLEAELLRRQREDDVAHAGPVAGHSVGVYEVNGSRILVTSSGCPVTAAPVNCARLVTVLTNMLGEEQFDRFLCWLKFRRRAVSEHAWMPGQAIAFVGPACCGKSYLQHLITLSLGGRVAKPWRYMSGGTEFNGDLIGCEHLAIEDDAPKADIYTRRAVGNHIKSMLFARAQSGHAKNRQAVTLEPCWAITFSINDEPENLQVLPPLDESLRDKLTIFRCELVPRSVPPNTTEQEWLEQLAKDELPGLVHMADNITVPPEWSDPRCGVCAYQHPEITAELSNLAPETQLLDIIDATLFAPPASSFWKGTAVELQNALENGNRKAEVQRLDSYRNAIATYLGRLQSQHPLRVQRVRTAARNEWKITAPPLNSGVGFHTSTGPANTDA